MVSAGASISYKQSHYQGRTECLFRPDKGSVFYACLCLFSQDSQFGTRSIVLSALFAQGGEADITGFHRFIEHYFLLFQVSCESTFQDRFTPFFTVHTYVDGVVFHITVAAVLTGQVSETFDC